MASEETSSVCLVDPDSGRVRQRLTGAGALLAFSPDSQLIVTRMENGSIIIWDATTARQVLRLHGQEKVVFRAAFTKDGQTLVTWSEDKKLCRWDVATGTLQKTMVVPLALRQHNFSLSPDAKILALAPRSRDAVQLWDTETGKMRCKLQGDLACARSLAFAPDGQTLATNWYEESSGNCTISLWDTATGRLRRRFPVPTRTAYSLWMFAPDGRKLLSTDSRFIFLWDTHTGQRLLHYPAHEGIVQSLGFTPDGRTLVSGSQDGTLRLWDTATGRSGHMLAGHRWLVKAVAVLPDGRSVLSAGNDGTLLLWDLATGKELRRLTIAEKPKATLKSANQVRCLTLSPDGSSAASYASGNSEDPSPLLHIWDLSSAKALFRRSADPDKPGGDVQLFSPDLRFYLTYEHPPSINELDGDPVPPTGTSFAVLREVASSRQLLALPQPDYVSSWLSLFSPDGRMLVTVTSRHTEENDNYRVDRHSVHFWELATGRERLTITCPKSGERYTFQQLALSPDSRTLATARQDNIIQLWEVATGRELLCHAHPDVDVRPLPFPGDVNCLAFAPDGQALAAGYWDSTILLWDLSSQARRPASPPAGDQELETWWADLTADDARKAHVAIWYLIDVPRQAIPLLRSHLSPVAGVPEDRLRRLLEDLDSEQFDRRGAASRELAELQERAFSALQKALRANPSPEQRQRIEALLNAAGVVRSPATVRGIRAIEVLEHVGTADAKEVLQVLSRGAPEARLTQEARASLTRLTRSRK